MNTTPSLPAPALEVISLPGPWHVEPGDRLIGCTAVIEGTLYDGATGVWLLVDRFGVIIARKSHWHRLQVIRGGLSADDTPAHIARPNLRLVK